jgi:hypothetical protein
VAHNSVIYGGTVGSASCGFLRELTASSLLRPPTSPPRPCTMHRAPHSSDRPSIHSSWPARSVPLLR